MVAVAVALAVLTVVVAFCCEVIPCRSVEWLQTFRLPYVVAAVLQMVELMPPLVLTS